MDLLRWGRSPWGEWVLPHVSWNLFWGSLFAGVLFLACCGEVPAGDKNEPSVLTVIDKDGKEHKPKNWKFVTGTRKLAWLAPAACAAIIIPSINMCELFCMSSRSLKVPGSDSSALHTRYLSMSPRGRKAALRPAGKPAPPRPRSPEASSSATTSEGSIASALRSAW